MKSCDHSQLSYSAHQRSEGEIPHNNKGLLQTMIFFLITRIFLQYYISVN